MKTPSIITTALALICYLLNPVSETAQAAGLVIRINGGPGRLTFHIPATLFESSELKFKAAVLANDLVHARHYIDRKYVDAPVQGYPPIAYAAARGNTEMAALLIKYGAANFRQHGKSLAYCSAYYGHIQTARYFVRPGAGTETDLQRGGEQYAVNSKREREQAQVVSALALAFVVHALDSAGSSSSSDDWWDGDNGAENRYLDPIGAGMHDTNRQLFGF